MTAPQPLRICIVTGQIVGPLQQGGIGTATTGLARLLASIGHDVTVLYTRGYQMSVSQTRHWSAVYAGEGIRFTPLDARRFGAVRGPMADLDYPAPAAVHEYLLANAYDIVHLNDLEGEGCIALAARKCGLAFENTVFATGLHSPTIWIETLNKEPARHSVAVAMDAAERFQIKNSDVLWSPSRYLLNWIQSRGFVLPRQSEVQQYVLPPLLGATAGADAAAPRPKVANLVFFGRIEERKGIFPFLDALDLIKEELKAKDIKVSFLGPHTNINGAPSAELIRKRAGTWSFSFEIIGSLPHRDALAFLAEPGKLAVMASPEDNSPCTVYEAMELGIPFIAASGGGIPELVKAAHHASVLFEPDAPSLAACLRRALAAPPPIPEPAFSQGDIKSQWQAHHAADGWPRLAPLPQAASVIAPANLAIVIEDTGSADDLARTLASLGTEYLSSAVIVSKRNALFASAPPIVAPEMLASHLSALQNPALLCLTAGFEIDPLQVQKLRTAASRLPQSVLLPSVMLNGRPAAAPPLSSALAYFHGPAPTGAMLIGPDLLRKVLASGGTTTGPFAGMADSSVAACEDISPYPAAIGSITPSALAKARPVPDAGRLAHYRTLAPEAQKNISDYVKMQAAAGRWSGRKLWLRLIASPLAPLAPWILEAGRLLRLTSR